MCSASQVYFENLSVRTTSQQYIYCLSTHVGIGCVEDSGSNLVFSVGLCKTRKRCSKRSGLVGLPQCVFTYLYCGLIFVHAAFKAPHSVALVLRFCVESSGGFVLAREFLINDQQTCDLSAQPISALISAHDQLLPLKLCRLQWRDETYAQYHRGTNSTNQTAVPPILQLSELG